MDAAAFALIVYFRHLACPNLGCQLEEGDSLTLQKKGPSSLEREDRARHDLLRHIVFQCSS